MVHINIGGGAETPNQKTMRAWLQERSMNQDGFHLPFFLINQVIENITHKSLTGAPRLNIFDTLHQAKGFLKQFGETFHGLKMCTVCTKIVVTPEDLIIYEQTGIAPKIITGEARSGAPLTIINQSTGATTETQTVATTPGQFQLTTEQAIEQGFLEPSINQESIEQPSALILTNVTITAQAQKQVDIIKKFGTVKLL